MSGISAKELNPKGVALSEAQKCNFEKLRIAINVVRTEYGFPMIVTSGVRSEADHKRIYAEKARRAGLKSFRVPMGSMHLKAAAVDIFDPTGRLLKWCKSNEKCLDRAGLWCEEGTVNWVHFQIYPPKSGKRWFLP